ADDPGPLGEPQQVADLRGADRSGSAREMRGDRHRGTIRRMDRSNQERLARIQPIRGDLVGPPGWAAGRGPLHRLLADAIAGLVATGELAPGTPLPTERGLAGRIGVSRATVAGAYRLLKAAGRVESRQGRGTW